MNDENLILLRRFDRINQAEMARSILESAGIFSTIRGEYVATVLPVGPDLDAGLMVREGDAERARALLEAFDRPADEPAAEETEARRPVL